MGSQALAAQRAGFVPFPYRRVSVVGTSASGKSTLARALAEVLQVAYVELDALHWERNWTEVPDPVMRERVDRATAGDGWVVDGNYSVTRDIVWGRAAAVVWLDVSLRTILRQYLARTWRRGRSREELWPGTGNHETVGMHLFRRDGLLWWILSTYRRRRREYPELIAAYPHLHAVRLASPAAARAWLAHLAAHEG